MDPVLIEVPERIETERLILRCPRPGDGPTMNEAERETRAELRPLMPWAHTRRASTTPRPTAGACRRATCCAKTWRCSSSSAT